MSHNSRYSETPYDNEEVELEASLREWLLLAGSTAPADGVVVNVAVGTAVADADTDPLRAVTVACSPDWGTPQSGIAATLPPPLWRFDCVWRVPRVPHLLVVFATPKWVQLSTHLPGRAHIDWHGDRSLVPSLCEVRASNLYDYPGALDVYGLATWTLA